MKSRNIHIVFNTKDFDGSATLKAKLTSNRLSIAYPELAGLAIQTGDYLLLDAKKLLKIPEYYHLANPIVEVQKIENVKTNLEVYVRLVFSLHYEVFDVDADEKQLLVAIYEQAKKRNKMKTAEVDHAMLDGFNIIDYQESVNPAPQSGSAHNAFYALPHSHNGVVNYYLTSAKNKLAAASIKPVKMFSSAQSNDVVVIDSKPQLIGSIVWDVRNRNQVDAYLISDGEVSLDDDMQVITHHEDDDVVVFSKHKHMRRRYQIFKNRVASKYHSILNLAKAARAFVLKKFRIKTFLGNAKRRAAINTAGDSVCHVAAIAASAMPVGAVSSVWNLGLQYAANHVRRYLDSKQYQVGAEGPALEKMIAESEFKFDQFSDRLNHAYWEVMERYQQILTQASHVQKLTDEEFLGENGLAENFATWDALREETLEYADFLDGISKAMRGDLKNMNLHMNHVKKHVEKRIIEDKTKNLGYRSPQVLVASSN
jgi:hypothetical protein